MICNKQVNEAQGGLRQFSRAILFLAIDILEYVFNCRECRGQTTANHKRISCCIDCHVFTTYTRIDHILHKPASPQINAGISNKRPQGLFKSHHLDPASI